MWKMSVVYKVYFAWTLTSSDLKWSDTWHAKVHSLQTFNASLHYLRLLPSLLRVAMVSGLVSQLVHLDEPNPRCVSSSSRSSSGSSSSHQQGAQRALVAGHIVFQPLLRLLTQEFSWACPPDTDAEQPRPHASGLKWSSVSADEHWHRKLTVIVKL